MRFPHLLRCTKCKPFPKEKIHPKNLVYSRHAPDSVWKRGEKFPDINQIKENQSFNWSAFSIPQWVRFNPEKVYQKEQGVCAFPVYAIRKAHLCADELPEDIFEIKHDPIKINYSHCQIYPKYPGKRAYKMALRHSLKINAKPKIPPGEEQSWWIVGLEFFNMLKHRILVLLKRPKESF